MILRNGKPFNIDSSWTDENGTQYPANWYRLASQSEREEKGFTEVSDPEPIDTRFYYVNTDGTTTQKPLNVCRDVLKNELASIRWSRETQGIVYDGLTYATDESSRVNYIGALIQAQANPNYSVLWKAKVEDATSFTSQSVFVTLNSADIIAITSCGVDYVSKCFETESQKRTEIDSALDLNELLSINLNEGWPNRVYIKQV